MTVTPLGPIELRHLFNTTWFRTSTSTDSSAGGPFREAESRQGNRGTLFAAPPPSHTVQESRDSLMERCRSMRRAKTGSRAVQRGGASGKATAAAS